MNALKRLALSSIAIMLCAGFIAACNKPSKQSNASLNADPASNNAKPDPMKNEYPGFDASREAYTAYATRMMNDPLLRMDKVPGFISKRLSPGDNSITVLNPHQTMEVKFEAANGETITYPDVVVGNNAGPNFECMGACGGGCPAKGIPMGFTKDCLIHDYCVLKFGIKEEKMGDHPECGKLFDHAEDDFMKFGHLRQKK